MIALARKYIWWLSPEEALQTPARVIAQVMNYGVLEEEMEMLMALVEDCLRQVLKHAEAGWFNDRAGSFWHARLGENWDSNPDLPKRRLD
jgi:hypothetical protein